MSDIGIKPLLNKRLDQTKQQVIKWIKLICKENGESDDPLYLFIMGHGSDLGILDATKKENFTDEMIIQELCTPQMKNMLKLVIFVSCRGEKEPHKAIYFNDAVPIENDNIKNLIALYSCKKGYVSKRHYQDGVPFVREFCKEFKTNFSKKTILSIFDDVRETLSAYDIGDSNNVDVRSLSPELKQFDVSSKYLKVPLSECISENSNRPPSKRFRRAPLRFVENLK